MSPLQLAYKRFKALAIFHDDIYEALSVMGFQHGVKLCYSMAKFNVPLSQ